jgi:signal transduction histidine kinase
VKRKAVVSSISWALGIGVAIALGLSARAPTFPGMGSGKMLPRVPALPPNLPELLFMLGVGSVVWYATLVSLPFLIIAARRVHTRAMLFGGALSAFAVLFLVTATIEYFVNYEGAGAGPPFGAFLADALRNDSLPWIAVAAIVIAVESRRRSIQSRLEREQFRAQVAEQRLIALTGQLQPHFLFNTLQGISTLIHRDPNAADEMLSRLSDLLRDLLRNRDTALVPLDDELRYIRTYLEISKFRFEDRLSFTIDSNEADKSIRVPLFILQPLVENALNHGIGSRAEGGTIIVRAERHNGMLRLEVEDDGRGLDSSVNDGVGLTNTRDRLHASFGSHQSFKVGRNSAGGVTASIEVPA